MPTVLELETQQGGWCPAVGDKALGSQPMAPAGRGADAGLQLGPPVPGLLGAARVGREGGTREALSGGRGDCPEGAAHSPAGNSGREPCAHKRRPEVSRGGAELPEVRQREESGLEEKVAFPALGRTRVSCGGLGRGPPAVLSDAVGVPAGGHRALARWGHGGGALGQQGRRRVWCDHGGAPPPCRGERGTPAGPGVPLRRVPRR